MTEPEKEPTSEDVDLEKETLEEATLEETRAQGEQEFDSTLYRLVAITGLISFYGPILYVFFVIPLSLGLGNAELFARVLFLLFFAIPISAIVGLFSCLLLWVAPTTKSDLKVGIVFSALADVFGLGVSALAPYILIALSPFGD
jgi:hypothetical protein